MGVIKSQTLHKINSDTDYFGCTFYIKNRIEELQNCKFDNCSFRSKRLEIVQASNCHFINCTFNELLIHKADHYFDEEKPPQNTKNLPVIKTARTVHDINRAAKEGFRPLVKPVRPSESIHNMLAVFQNNRTGEISVSGDCRYQPNPSEYTQVIDYTYYYPYHFPNPFAAYLIPKDLKPDTRVWIDDVIEDIVSVFGNQGYHPRLTSGEAIWDGEDIDMVFNPERDAQVWIG